MKNAERIAERKRLTEIVAAVDNKRANGGALTLVERICSEGIRENLRGGTLRRAQEAAATLIKHNTYYSVIGESR